MVRSASGTLWQGLLRRPASESGTLCHGEGGHGEGSRRRSVLMFLRSPVARFHASPEARAVNPRAADIAFRATALPGFDIAALPGSPVGISLQSSDCGGWSSPCQTRARGDFGPLRGGYH
jgi:hypothetical protein